MIGHGWQAMTALFSPGDRDGDGNADLVARRNDGTLFLYPGNGAGGFGPTRKIGAGWNVMTGFVMTDHYTSVVPDDGQPCPTTRRVDDWNQDGMPDGFALTRTYDGAILIYYGNDSPRAAGLERARARVERLPRGVLRPAAAGAATRRRRRSWR